ncbi:MAG: hypothetical protein NT118_16740 [Lentisphaerae bacterium]|nr:hypothetical protein [Lentisphaerota bacterium]
MNAFKRNLIGNDLVWAVSNITLLPVCQYLKKCRSSFVRNRILDQFRNDMKVADGIFAGLRYPEFKPFGSALLPKLLGTYENEIRPAMNKILSKQYPVVLNIGCAEGYYAVGLALKFTKSEVFAYDTSEKARSLCRQMAEANNVADRIRIGGECRPETLADFDFSAGGLIICDCEGGERHIFNSDNVKNLKNCDLLIELHDFADRSITGHIAGLFADSHKMTFFHSIDDYQKAVQYKSHFLQDKDLSVRKYIFAEDRVEIMNWVFLESSRP